MAIKHRSNKTAAKNRNETLAKSVTGAQSIHRATGVLRAITSRSRDGVRLVDIARHCDLERPSCCSPFVVGSLDQVQADTLMRGQNTRQMPLAVAQTFPWVSRKRPSAKAVLRLTRTTLPWASKRSPIAALR